ncbi:hypothetical protein PR048_006866, partial [Dryococelus australis]
MVQSAAVKRQIKDLDRASQLISLMQNVTKIEFLSEEIKQVLEINGHGAVDIVNILIGLKEHHPTFASSSLQALWVPVTHQSQTLTVDVHFLLMEMFGQTSGVILHQAIWKSCYQC